MLLVMNFVGSMIVNIVVELYVAEVVENAFILFDENLDLLVLGDFHVFYNYFLIKCIPNF